MIINNHQQNDRYNLLKYSSCERKPSSSIISDTRKIYDQMYMENLPKFITKSPKMSFQHNQLNLSGSKKNEQLLDKAFKQIEQIKHKHSQHFNESHFSLERIGLNPKSYSSIVYKKQQTNCINPILEYINRNNIGIPQDFQYKSELKKSMMNQKQKQFEDQTYQYDEAQHYPSQNESYYLNDHRRSKLQTRIKDLKNIEQDQNEYSQQVYEQLKNILSPKKKSKENEIDPLKQHNLRYKAKFQKNSQKIQIKGQTSGATSPMNQSPQRVFSPPKNVEFNNKNQAIKLNQSYLNKSDIISTSSTPNQNQQQKNTSQDNKQQKSGIAKGPEKKSDQLFEYLNSQKNPIIVEGKILSNEENKNKQNGSLRYSKDDSNKQDNKQLNNQTNDIQLRKYSTPLKAINDYKNNNANLNQSTKSKQRYNKSQEIQQMNKTECTNQKQQDSKNQVNINFLNVQNYSSKIKENKSQIIDNKQFDDSFILSHSSPIKQKQNSVNISLHQQNEQNKLGELESKSSAMIPNNQSVILNSIAYYEEADLAVQQHEVQKQNKTNKYLSRLGLNNKYSKRDYLKVQNQSYVNQEFLNINFDSENLNPKQKNVNPLQGKISNSSQKSILNEKIIPQLGEQLIRNSKKRSITTQQDQIQFLNKQRFQEMQTFNKKNISQQNYELKNSQLSNQNQNLLTRNKEQYHFIKEKTTQNTQQNNFISPVISRNMSILQQCDNESKNIHHLSKMWEKNIDKMAKEKNQYDQQYSNLQEQTVTNENTSVFQYYQKQRFNTDF